MMVDGEFPDVHAYLTSLVFPPSCLDLLFQGGEGSLGSVNYKGIPTFFAGISGSQLGLDEYIVVGIKQKRKGVFPFGIQHVYMNSAYGNVPRWSRG